MDKPKKLLWVPPKMDKVSAAYAILESIESSTFGEIRKNKAILARICDLIGSLAPHKQADAISCIVKGIEPLFD